MWTTAFYRHHQATVVRTFYLSWLCVFPCAVALGQIPVPASARSPIVHYHGADWRLKGEGVVCCPCAVPCPCRQNSPPTYGHCEATLYLNITQGNYGTVDLNGLRTVHIGGQCSMSYQKLGALFFERSAEPEQQAAFMELLASFFPDGAAEFPHVRTVPIDVRVTESHIFHVSIPNTLDMEVDRSWSGAAPPLPEVAALDPLSNTIQYAENLRYEMHDDEAGLNFNYSHRQANYRKVNLNVNQYRCQSMLIQFQDGAGWFNKRQLDLVDRLGLTLPEPEMLARQLSQFRKTRVQP
jgi:hypothetical protein